MSQNRLRLLFHGFIHLWLRNSGLCPLDSLATAANFISWNNAIRSKFCSCLFHAALRYALQSRFLILLLLQFHPASGRNVPEPVAQDA